MHRLRLYLFLLRTWHSVGPAGLEDAVPTTSWGWSGLLWQTSSSNFWRFAIRISASHFHEACWSARSTLPFPWLALLTPQMAWPFVKPMFTISCMLYRSLPERMAPSCVPASGLEAAGSSGLDVGHVIDRAMASAKSSSFESALGKSCSDISRAFWSSGSSWSWTLSAGTTASTCGCVSDNAIDSSSIWASSNSSCKSCSNSSSDSSMVVAFSSTFSSGSFSPGPLLLSGFPEQGLHLRSDPVRLQVAQWYPLSVCSITWSPVGFPEGRQTITHTSNLMQTTPTAHHDIQREVLARHLAEVAPSEEALTSSGSVLGCAVEVK